MLPSQRRIRSPATKGCPTVFTRQRSTLPGYKKVDEFEWEELDALKKRLNNATYADPTSRPFGRITRRASAPVKVIAHNNECSSSNEIEVPIRSF